MALAVALAGMTLTLGAIVWYFLVINREKVPVSVGPFAASLLLGMATSLAGVGLSPGVATAVPAGVALALGGFILWLLTQRRLPDGELIVGVGDPMPALVATDDTGADFDLASLKGRRVMLKFFRGSW